MRALRILQALANDRRRQILEWLKNPESHYPLQDDGDLVKDGVCVRLIAEKLGISESALREHMRVLAQAKFVQSKRIKQCTFYKRDENAIRKQQKFITSEI
jgi:DNA-binding transcriptional ArsR family regulator